MSRKERPFQVSIKRLPQGVIMTNDLSAQQETELDEQLMETFPASDPPSNTIVMGLGHSDAATLRPDAVKPTK